jgi:hypothetical protein
VVRGPRARCTRSISSQLPGVPRSFGADCAVTTPPGANILFRPPRLRIDARTHSPSRIVQTGLRICPSEKMAAKPVCRNERDTFSGPVSGRESRNCVVFERFSGKCALVSLRPRLNGGESGIRTHVTLSSKHAFQACAFSHSAISPVNRLCEQLGS